MSGASLVHPETAKLPPDSQKKGVYDFTPFEVHAYLRGEEISDSDMVQVIKYYEQQGFKLPVRPLVNKPALADQYVGQEAVVAPAKRLVKKQAAPVYNSPLKALVTIAEAAVTSLPDAEAYKLLQILATRFELEIE